MKRRAVGRLAWGAGFAPSLGVAALSKFTCSLCLAGYAGVLSSLGLGVVATDRGLIVLTAVFLMLNLLSIGWSTRHTRHSGPVSVALIGSAALLAGRLWWPLPVLIYAGTGAVLGASVWNLLIQRRRRSSIAPLGRAPNRAGAVQRTSGSTSEGV